MHGYKIMSKICGFTRSWILILTHTGLRLSMERQQLWLSQPSYDVKSMLQHAWTVEIKPVVLSVYRLWLYGWYVDKILKCRVNYCAKRTSKRKCVYHPKIFKSLEKIMFKYLFKKKCLYSLLCIGQLGKILLRGKRRGQR